MAAQRKQLTFAECDALITKKGGEFEMVEVMENGHKQRVWKNVGGHGVVAGLGVEHRW